jgi:Protein of unknown function (DUF3237)
MTAPISTRPLMRVRLATSPPQQIGPTPEGALTIFPVTGGSFEGERLRGSVLAGGGDWVTARSNGMMTLDMRIALETDDGSLIYMTLTGIRDDANGYFRTVLRFETAAPMYAFLNRLLAVGTAEIGPEGPVHRVEEIL